MLPLSNMVPSLIVDRSTVARYPPDEPAAFGDSTADSVSVVSVAVVSTAVDVDDVVVEDVVLEAVSSLPPLHATAKSKSVITTLATRVLFEVIIECSLSWAVLEVDFINNVI